MCSTSFAELDYEKEKLAYSSLRDIVDLEQISFLKHNISNFYFDGKIHLKAKEVIEIGKNPILINKALRSIYSFADDKYGKFQELLLDKTLIKSGHKQLYYEDKDDQATSYFHKLSFSNTDSNTDEFGDRNLTADGNGIYADISVCVKEFVKAISKKVYVDSKSLMDAIDELLAERIALSDYSDPLNVKWYIVKYEEFFYDKKNTTLSVLRRKKYGDKDDDNVYDMRCISDDNDFSKYHYNPFHLALCHKLNNRVTIDEESLKYSGVQIEYLHPCELSNGWIVKMDEDGNWSIDFKGKPLASSIPGITINTAGDTKKLVGIIDCKGCDSIEKAATIINSL